MIRSCFTAFVVASITCCVWADESVVIDGTRLTVPVPVADGQTLSIPRYHAPLRSAMWLNSDEAVTVTPEPDHWVVSWKSRPTGADSIVMTFDQPPHLDAAQVVAKQLGDGRVDLHAFAAATTGKKLRFEPQPHKNTVGYWVNENDVATWTMDLDVGGTFNVGILQGCGGDQGGSDMQLSIERDGETIAELEFVAEETGHFQNFVWRTVGKLAIKDPGRYTVKLKPIRIANKAAMDVRQIQLVKLAK